MSRLLDCGPSRRGWSYWGAYARCLKFGRLTSLGMDDETEPRTRGILGHIGTGHLHIRQMLMQQGRNPDEYLEPEAAMQRWSELHPQGVAHLDRMIETYRRYVTRFPDPSGRRIVAVEQELVGVLGLLDGQFGLWALRDGEDVRNLTPVHVSGRYIRAATLNCPGHPEHGLPISGTRKIDLAFEDNEGRLYVSDTKFKGSDVTDSYGYFHASSGENALARILAKQIWPHLTGLVLLLIQTKEPWKIARPVVPESAWRDRLFPKDLFRLAHVVAQLERDEPDADSWPMASHMTVCVGRHEKTGCPALWRCMSGPPERSF